VFAYSLIGTSTNSTILLFNYFVSYLDLHVWNKSWNTRPEHMCTIACARSSSSNKPRHFSAYIRGSRLYLSAFFLHEGTLPLLQSTAIKTLAYSLSHPKPFSVPPALYHLSILASGVQRCWTPEPVTFDPWLFVRPLSLGTNENHRNNSDKDRNWPSALSKAPFPLM